MNMQTATSQLKPFFRFPIQDSQSTSRFVIGSALLLGGFIVPILPGLLVFGYVLQVLRSSAKGEPPSMPAWDNWSSLLSLGFRGAIVSFLFTLPGFAVCLLGFAICLGTFFLIALTSGAEPSGNDPMFALLPLGMVAMFLCIALGSLLFILGIVPLPASVSHFVVKDQLSAAFRVREWWPILSANRLGYFISFVIVAGILGAAYLGFVALYYTLVLMCLMFFIMLPVSFYTMLVGGALFGDAYREGCQSAEKPQEAHVSGGSQSSETTFVGSIR